jgi:hypothetical protein
MTAEKPTSFPVSAFFSYSRADLESVKSIAVALRRFGVGTWMDVENLRPGERWKDAIEKALDSANAMVLCLSPLSVESTWTSVELQIALSKGLKIIPLMVEPVSIELLAPAIRTLQIFDMSSYARYDAAAAAARAVVSALGMPVPENSLAGSLSSGEVVVSLEDGNTQIAATDGLLPPGIQVHDAIYLRVFGIDPAVFNDVLGHFERSRRVAIVVAAGADRSAACFLLGMAVGCLGPRSVTLIEIKGSPASLEAIATACRSHYVLWSAGERSPSKGHAVFEPADQ